MNARQQRLLDEVVLMANAVCIPFVPALAALRPLTAEEEAGLRFIVTGCFAAHASGRLNELVAAVRGHGEGERALLERVNSAGNN